MHSLRSRSSPNWGWPYDPLRSGSGGCSKPAGQRQRQSVKLHAITMLTGVLVETDEAEVTGLAGTKMRTGARTMSFARFLAAGGASSDARSFEARRRAKSGDVKMKAG